jgi:hypothetical protein
MAYKATFMFDLKHYIDQNETSSMPGLFLLSNLQPQMQQGSITCWNITIHYFQNFISCKMPMTTNARSLEKALPSLLYKEMRTQLQLQREPVYKQKPLSTLGKLQLH